METILLVDDNPLRASVRRSALERKASSVVRVLDAAEALCTVETPELAQTLRLVVTVHPMSGIPGPEFVAEFRMRMPQVPVLVVSSVSGFEKGYQGIEGVYFSNSPSAEELFGLADSLLEGMGQRQTA
jgi:CheY-like chemotaxis protein